MAGVSAGPVSWLEWRVRGRYQRRTDGDEKVIALLSEFAERLQEHGFGKHPVHPPQRAYVEPQAHVARILPDEAQSPSSVGAVSDASSTAARIRQPTRCWAVVRFHVRCAAEGLRPRMFDVTDDFSREALAIEVDRNLPLLAFIHTLERVAAWRRYLPNFVSTTATNVTSWRWPGRLGARASCWIHRGGLRMQSRLIEGLNGSHRRCVWTMHRTGAVIS